MAGASSTGSPNYAMFEPETTAGTFITPTNTVYVTGNSSTNQANVKKISYMAGNRWAETGIRVTKINQGGQLQYPLFPYQGIGLLKGAIGKYTNVAALTADSVKAATPVSTAAGISTITLTNTGSATYSPGAWFTINTAVNQEIRQILSITGNGAPSTVITCRALVANAAATNPVVVQQLAQHKFSPLVYGDTNYQTLPTYSFELVKGSGWSWRRAGVYIANFSINGGQDSVDVQADLFPTAVPTQQTSPTAFAPTVNEAADVDKFFTIMDGGILVANDQGASGSSTMSMLKQVTSWDLKITNNMVQSPQWDGTQYLGGVPGTASAMVDFTFNNYAKANSFYRDYVASTALGGQEIPFFTELVINRGTLSSPTWNTFGIYVPNLFVENAPETDQLNQFETVSVSGDCVRPSGADALAIYCVNAKTPASNAY